MGSGATKTPAQWTSELWKAIDNTYYHSSIIQQAQQALAGGAHITTPNRRGKYMFPTVKQRRDLNETAGKIYECQFCDQLLAILREHASLLLTRLLVDENGKNRNDLRLVITLLGADCYQNEKYGSLGLLGEILRKGTATREVIQLLIESDDRARLGLGKRDTDESCMDLAKVLNNNDVVDYLQMELNKLLNKMPFERNDISTEDIHFWIINGANTEWKDEHGETVLCKAVDANKLDLCEALVAAGANTLCQNRNGQTPVQIARSKIPVNPQIIRILESRVIIDELISAIVHHDSVDDIRAILSRGADINKITNAHQNTFLHLLILNNGSADVVKMFVNDYNGDINAMNIKSHRAVETAIMCNSDEETICSILTVLFRLKQFNTDLFYNEKLKQSILRFCDNQKEKPQVRELIQAELNQRLYKLCHSSSDDNESNDEKDKKLIQELATLVQCGAQIDHQQKNESYGECTIVHVLCKLGNLKLLKYVIETLRATTFHEKTESGDYPISIAAEHGHQAIVHYLRDTFDQISLNVSNLNGDTPLHKSAKNNHFLVVRYLVQWGADPHATNNVQQTPLALVTPSDNNRPMIQFLEQLNHVPDEQSVQTRPHSAHRLSDDFDFCRLVIPVVLDRVNPNFETSPESNRSTGLLEDSPNARLFRAAKIGDYFGVQNAIAAQADVRYLDGGRSSFAVVMSEWQKNQNELNTIRDYHQRQVCIARVAQYSKLAEYLTDIATTKIREAIKQGSPELTMAYHQCGAKITPDLLTLACQSAKDNKEIVDYLITRDQQMYKALFTFDHRNESPYSMALKKKYTNIVDYIQWRLTEDLINAVKQNNTELVKQLLLAGANPEKDGQRNLDQAIEKNNEAMVRVLCEHGAHFPSSTVTVDNPQIKFILKRYEINHRFRKAAANGKLSDIKHYHRQGADINAKNCHGATALLITLRSGEYYPIVYYLVSCGASILHSDITQPSVLHLAETRKYTEIFDYLSKQLNTQFLLAILTNDTTETDALAQLGTDFNCTDEEGRTPLHYAVQYHGVGLVKWLCNRGSNPMKADNNGHFPITQAAEKGDYAAVEYFIREHGATKQLKNKQGLDALAIAKRKHFNEIVQLLDPGNTEFKVTKKSKILKAKYTNERLDLAVKNGESNIIQEFIDQEYQSLKDKTEQCARMMQIAKQEKQFEILSMLQPHYAELTQELTSNQAAGRLVNLGEAQLTIFYGFMNNLSNLITGSHVTLDPANPQTYRDLFSHMMSTDEKRSQVINSIKSPQDCEQLCEQELNDMQEKIENLNKTIGQMKLEKQKLTEQIHTFEKQLNDENVSAIDKKQYFKDKQTIEDALNALESSVQLSRQAHETAQNKKKLLDYIKTTLNLFVFYTTIEHRLQSLFIGVLAAQTEIFKTELSSKTAKVATAVIDIIPLDSIPVVGSFMGPIKSATQSLVETVDKRRQKAEWYNISVLGNIEELQKAASTTAGLLTLYYNQQIQLIDTASSKIRGSNMLSTAVSTVSTLIEGSPEPEDQRTIVLIAEFIAEFIIDILKEKKDRKEKCVKDRNSNPILPDKPLAEQMWLFVAKENFLKLKKSDSFAATTGFGLTKRVIRIRKRRDGAHIEVQVRQLLGYVSLITDEGKIYRVKTDTGKKDEKAEFDDTEDIFGYALIDPFISDDQTIIGKICAGRELEELTTANKDMAALIADDKIKEGVHTLREVSTASGSNEGITKRMALSVGRVLQNEKVFLTKNEVDTRLNKHEVGIKYNVDSLREEMKDSTRRFQTSIDAAYEKIGKDFDSCTQKILSDNQEHYQKSIQKINEHQQQLQERLDKSNAARMSKIEDQLKKKSDEMMTIAADAKQNSQEALEKSKAAKELSMKCEQEAKVASEKAEALVVSTDQRKQEMQRTIDECMNKVRQTVDEQKQAYETSLNELQRQIKTDLQTLRTTAVDANRHADDAEKSAKNLEQQMRQLVDNQKKEMDKLQKQQKEETDRLIRVQEEKMKDLINNQEKERKAFQDTIKDMNHLIEQARNESKDAAKEARRAADASEKALKKADK